MKEKKTNKVVEWAKSHKTEIATTIGLGIAAAVILKVLGHSSSHSNDSVFGQFSNANDLPLPDIGLDADTLDVCDYWVDGGHTVMANIGNIPTDKMVDVCGKLVEDMHKYTNGTNGFIIMGIEKK